LCHPLLAAPPIGLGGSDPLANGISDPSIQNLISRYSYYLISLMKRKTANPGDSTDFPEEIPSNTSSMSPATLVSWITERDVLREFGDRRTRAILAILTARRSARSVDFFVPPHIANLFHLAPKDLCWALQKLEGVLVNTVTSTKGRFRKVRLAPRWEQRVGDERPSRPKAGRSLGDGLRSLNSTSAESRSEEQTGRTLWKDASSAKVDATLIEIALEHSRGGFGISGHLGNSI
jgi:hypothetical protein